MSNEQLTIEDRLINELFNSEFKFLRYICPKCQNLIKRTPVLTKKHHKNGISVRISARSSPNFCSFFLFKAISFSFSCSSAGRPKFLQCKKVQTHFCSDSFAARRHLMRSVSWSIDHLSLGAFQTLKYVHVDARRIKKPFYLLS